MKICFFLIVIEFRSFNRPVSWISFCSVGEGSEGCCYSLRNEGKDVEPLVLFQRCSLLLVILTQPILTLVSNVFSPKSGALMCLFKSYYYHQISIVAQNHVGSTLASSLNHCRPPERAPNVLVIYIYILYIRSPGLPITKGSPGQTVQSGRVGPGPDVYKRKSVVLGISF
jgi:hypothetical protein